MEPRITYIRNRKNFPVACLAYSFDKNTHIITYGIAVHNPQDHFDRKVAIALAKERFSIQLNQIKSDRLSPLKFFSGAIALDDHTTNAGGAITGLLRFIKNYSTDAPMLLRSAASQYLRHKKVT